MRQRNAELRHLAVTDPLTGLGNRTLLFDRLEFALTQRERSGGDVGVVFCDVNDFKAINDRHGHQIGDRVLCEIADQLRSHVRAVDTVARISGDEFVIVCPHITAVALDHIVKRITDANDRLLPDGSRGSRLSVGTVIASANEDAASVLRRADCAMYAAKARHKTAASTN
jgi:diguanylate cyclase (GGDEF)-like protein